MKGKERKRKKNIRKRGMSKKEGKKGKKGREKR